MGKHADWLADFQKHPQYTELTTRPVAYFCAEFALDASIHTYAGGLGILAGDVVREAADRALPMVAVGLYYQQGYICRQDQQGGKFVEVCEDIPPEQVGLKLVTRQDGSPITIRVPIQDREVAVQVWQFDVEPTTPEGTSVPVYFLDTNIAENNEADRAITQRLYTADKETRLRQELILGIGGLRFLEALQVHPLVYHLNEGHSAFLAIELIRHEMEERGLEFDAAKQFARRRMVFTNHTLVAAGNETYDNDLVSLMIAPYCQKLGVPVNELVKLGLVHESSTFSMTMLSLRMASLVNGVSKLHAEKAKDVWTDHPMIAVTNGVHVPTWDSIGQQDLSAPGAFWAVHLEQKRELLKMVAEETGQTWDERDLILGWARRITTYKRPLAALEDVERFAGIARQADRPIRLLLAGQPHPSDTEGRKILDEIQTATKTLQDCAVYISGYNMKKAQRLIAGCDVWLNTPVIGFEASGTSGMKAALNGVLPCSTRDGWMGEIDFYGVGWMLDDKRIGTSLLDTLEQSIIPLYYQQENGIPVLWEQNMRNARDMILKSFSATRMLRQYTELLYS